MTPGGKVGHRAFAAVGYMSNDAETQSAAPLHLGRLSAAFACSPRGAGAEEKRKAASPMEAARSVT